MSIISLGNIDKRLLFSLFGAVFKLIANIILYHSKVKMREHPCILGINAGIGLSLAFFPFLYLKIKSRIYSSPNSSQAITAKMLSEKGSINLNYKNKRKNKINWKKYFYILMVSLLDFTQKFLTFFYPDLFLENFWIFDSSLLLLFSFLILKAKVYSHHLISLIMIIIIGIALIVVNYNNDDKNIFIEIVITLTTEIFFSLENVVCKLAVNVKFTSPYEVCFYVGIFELIIFSILLIIFTNVPIYGGEYMNIVSEEHIDNYNIYKENYNFTEAMIFILSMFGRCIFILAGFVTLDYFTPLHIVLILIIGEISFLFNDEHNWKLYLKIFFFICLMFFVLIFVEIIELNIFGLQKNTKRNITQRSDSEEINATTLNLHSNDENGEQRLSLTDVNYYIKV